MHDHSITTVILSVCSLLSGQISISALQQSPSIGRNNLGRRPYRHLGVEYGSRGFQRAKDGGGITSTRTGWGEPSDGIRRRTTRTAAFSTTSLSAASSGYFPEPEFRVMHTGEGSISTSKNDERCDRDRDCQYAQFGPRIPFAGRIELASPPEANAPLSPSSSSPPVVVVVKRGLCSFEAKMRAAVEIGAEGVILVNDHDDTFLAVADVRSMPGEEAGDATPPPPQREIPFVVVSSSMGAALTDGCHVSVAPLGDGISTCFGRWNDANNDEEMILPLFPVSKEPLLPGAEITVKLGKLEREELRRAEAAAGEGGDGARDILVAVAFCTDPTTNLMAVRGCTAKVLAGPTLVRDDRSVILRGIEPCTLRTLVRDSTRTSFGLALLTEIGSDTTKTTAITTGGGNTGEGGASSHKITAAEVREKLRLTSLQACEQAGEDGFCDVDRIDEIDDEINALPADPVGLSFAACRSLALPPRQMQAALACSTAERFRGATKILDRIAQRNDGYDDDEGEGEKHNRSFSRNFVSNAVKKVLPSVVRVELSSGGSENKAAGFIVGSDGTIVTNRHVVVPKGDDGPGNGVVITFQDGTALPAKILAVSEGYDIAFLRAIPPASSSQKKRHFPVAPMGDGDGTRLGDWVIAVGSPAEFDNLVSLGIVSTVQRPKAGIRNGELVLDRSAAYIGTDALFNKGISGGPLVNDAGDVVGMCTYMREDLNGLGFAIAMNRIEDAAHELLDGLDITTT